VDAMEYFQETEQPAEEDCFEGNTVTQYGKIAYNTTEKTCCVTQNFLSEVEMTGKQDFRMPVITLEVSE
jgi:hypothetical protein